MLTAGSRIYKTKIEIFYHTQNSNYIYFEKSSEIPNHFLHTHLLYLVRIYLIKNVYF